MRKNPPKKGTSFIAWKKGRAWYSRLGYAPCPHGCYTWQQHHIHAGDVLIKMRIPAHAERSEPLHGKFRVSEAEVLEIVDIRYDTKGRFNHRRKPNKLQKGLNYYGNKKRLVYQVGKTAKPDKYYPSRFTVCAAGIHCYLDKKSAINHGK